MTKVKGIVSDQNYVIWPDKISSLLNLLRRLTNSKYQPVAEIFSENWQYRKTQAFKIKLRAI